MSQADDDPTTLPDQDDALALQPASADNAQILPGVERSLLVVGIGASAGGLIALEQLLGRLGADGMAFVVFQHLAPDHESLLPEILARHTVLRVVSVEDQQLLERDTIHVVPPGRGLRIERDRLVLVPLVDADRRHPIDGFMRSLARERGPGAIGILLSGAGSDGTLGLQRIKEEGGITFVQDPATAGHGGMPQSALDAGLADFCLSPAEIGDELMRIGAHPLVAARRLPRLFSPDTLDQIFQSLRQVFGVDFSGYKLSTIERRIARRMALLHVERAPDYATRIEHDRGELRALYSDLLIGVTSFFRDKEPFEALKTQVFQRLLQSRSLDLPIRIWVAGCATGEEAYSIVIALLEVIDEHPGGHKIQVFASDINEEALSKARQGIYPGSIELDVSAGRLQRFFTKIDQGYQVSRRVRDLVVFAGHNLGKDPPFSKLDLVSCRNVLIYLQPALQKKVVRSFHYALNRDGFLLLGASESVGDSSDLFSLVDRDLKLYLKKNVASNGVFDFSLGGRAGAQVASLSPAAIPERRPAVSAQQLADRKVLDRYAPPGVIIDESLQVMQFRGQTGRYLAPSPGTASLNILKLVRPELMVALRSAVQSALTEKVPVSSESLQLCDGEGAQVAIDVLPLREAADHAGSLLILFRERPTAKAEGTERPPASQALEPASSEQVQQLQRELLTNKEYLETIIHELETANEELQGANEELQSANEELQSTNEELETSKEELQSSNEELATVNEELHARMTQLAVAKDDLVNLLSNISSPVVLVGLDLRIRRFSAAAEKELSLIGGDVGRPVTYLASLLNAPQLEELVRQTIQNMRASEQNVRCSNGASYTLRTVPYQTADRAINGVVIELIGTPPLRRPGDTFGIHELVGKVLSTLPHALMLLDDRLRLIWANRAFFEGGLVGGEAIGHPLEELWPSRASDPALWAALEEAAYGGRPFRDLWVSKPFGRSSGTPMKLSAQCIPAETDRPPMTLIVMEEVPGQGTPP